MNKSPVVFTKLFLLNFFVYQWSGYRRARVIDDLTGEEISRVWVQVEPLTGWTFLPDVVRKIYLWLIE